MNIATLLHGISPDRLAYVSLLMAAATSYVAFDLTNWLAVTRGKRRVLWLSFGSFAIGVGIWAANVLGIEAYSRPETLRYSLPMLFAAGVIIVLTVALCLSLTIRPTVTPRVRFGISLLFAFGLVGMLLLGSSALRVPASLVYLPAWCLASALAILGTSCLAFRLALPSHSDSILWSFRGARWASFFGVAALLILGLASSAIRVIAFSNIAQAGQHPLAATAAQRTLLIATALWILILCMIALRVDCRLVLHARQSLESRTELQTIFDNMTDGVIACDPYHNILMMNRAASELLGLPFDLATARIAAENLDVSTRDGEMLPYEEWPSVRARRGEFVRNYELSIRRKNTGTTVHVEVNTTSITKSGVLQQVITGYRDVSERRRSDEARARLAAIVESSEDAIISKSSTGIITSWNSGAEKVFGFRAEEMLGESILKLIPQDRWEEEHQILERVQRGEILSHYETIRVKQGGERINVSLTVSPIRDAQGRVVGASKIARDVTNTKKLEQQLHQSQKMDAIGQLTGGIAHDFNNLLGIVIGNLDLLERSVASDQAVLKQVQAAQRAALRGADLIRHLLAFASPETLSPAPTQLQQCIRGVLEMASGAIGPAISIVTAFDEDVPELPIDTAAFESSLLNLLVNARDAMPEGGTITVKTQLEHLSNSYPAVRTDEMKEGTYACVSVCDTGAGMSRETLEHAMEPFFTTKARGKGTGLGLAMVYSFAKQSGGTICICSELGYGTTISLYLPLSPRSVPPAPISVTYSEPYADDHVVLLVDDEIDLLDIATEYVSDCGYEALKATNAAEALKLMKDRNDIGLLITDIVMPGDTNGVELARQAIGLNPSLKVIYSSGFPADALSKSHLPGIGGVFLHKPYQRRDLAEAISRTKQSNSTVSGPRPN